MAKKDILSRIIQENTGQVDEITIYPELQALIPPLTTEELEGLEKSIVEEGCREPILLWENGNELILVDGHNRYSICKKHGLPYKTRLKEFGNFEIVKDWMISNQLGRRNLTELQKSYLRGLQYNREKKGLGGDRKKEKSGSQNGNLKTVDKLAEEHKVSRNTIIRDEKFALGLDKLTEGNKELKDKILNKSVKVPQSIVQEAINLDEKSVKKLAEKIQKEQDLPKLSKENKVKKKDTKEKLLENIMQKLKNYTYEKLLEIEKTL